MGVNKKADRPVVSLEFYTNDNNNNLSDWHQNKRHLLDSGADLLLRRDNDHYHHHHHHRQYHQDQQDHRHTGRLMTGRNGEQYEEKGPPGPLQQPNGGGLGMGGRVAAVTTANKPTNIGMGMAVASGSNGGAAKNPVKAAFRLGTQRKAVWPAHITCPCSATILGKDGHGECM